MARFVKETDDEALLFFFSFSSHRRPCRCFLFASSSPCNALRSYLLVVVHNIRTKKTSAKRTDVIYRLFFFFLLLDVLHSPSINNDDFTHRLISLFFSSFHFQDMSIISRAISSKLNRGWTLTLHSRRSFESTSTDSTLETRNLDSESQEEDHG